MIVNAPTLGSGGPARALVLKSWFKIVIQVVGPFTITIGTSKDEAGRLSTGNQADGLQLTQINTSPPFEIWWKGELWISGSAVGATCVIIVPGLAPSLFEAGGDQCLPEFADA